MDFLVTIIELFGFLYSIQLYQGSSYQVYIRYDKFSIPKLLIQNANNH